MALEVYKFGGASVKDALAVKNVGEIIHSSGIENLLVVVSATGKTTNALQQVVKDYFGKENDPFVTLNEIKKSHLEMCLSLFPDNKEALEDVLDSFVEIEWMLEEDSDDSFDYFYDQVVSVGEIVSSKILEHFLKTLGLKSFWLDVRDVILTDNTFREAKVDWKETEDRISIKCKDLFEANQIVVTQGFIGSSSENFTTTLGREGSDFSAAIFAYCLSAKALTIWKDVPGVLTADPRLFENASKLDRLSYREAIEMTYYGAKVIHPKTIKPVQNKSIALHVKSFVEPDKPGTLIDEHTTESYPPIVVFEHNQSLLRIATKDFSFVAEDHLSQIFDLIARFRVKVKMMKNTAVSFILSVDHDETKVEALMTELQQFFNVSLETGLELLTIRHYNEDTIKSLTSSRVILFEERLPNTIQMVVKPIATLKLKD